MVSGQRQQPDNRDILVMRGAVFTGKAVPPGQNPCDSPLACACRMAYVAMVRFADPIET
jgi:hypothetical protein